MRDKDRVKLKHNGTVEVDGSDTGWTWVKVAGWHPEYLLLNERRETLLSHYKRARFVLMVLDFHSG